MIVGGQPSVILIKTMRVFRHLSFTQQKFSSSFSPKVSTAAYNIGFIHDPKRRIEYH